MPSLASALGLGEITVFSKLNEPLKVQIELINSKTSQADEIIIKNASLNTYRRSNLPRPDSFNKVRFKIKKLNSGSLIAELTTKRPVREPFITFIADLKWRSGHINREYTFLLDPPEFVQKQIYKGKTKKATTYQASPSKSTATQRAPRKITHRKIDYSTVIANHVDGDTYTIKRADTLWNIAKKVKPSSNVSTYQTMQALYALNPQAFIKKNINLIKQGQTLNIPTQNEILQINGKAPLAKISKQTNTQKAAGNQPLSKQTKTSKPSSDKEKQPKTSIQAKAEQVIPDEGKAELKIIPTTDVLLNTPVTSKKDLIIINRALQNSITTIKSLSNENDILNEKIKSLTEKLNKLDSQEQKLNEKISEIKTPINNKPYSQKDVQKTLPSDSGETKAAIEANTKPNNDSQETNNSNTLEVDSELAQTKKPRSFIRELLTSPVITIALAIFTLIILIATLFIIRNQNEKRQQRKNKAYNTFPVQNKTKAPKTQTPAMPNTHLQAPAPKESDSEISLQGTDISEEKNEEDMDFFEYFEKKINAPDSVPNAKTPTKKIIQQPEESPEVNFDLDISHDEIEAYEKSISKPKERSINSSLSEIDTYLAYGNYDEAEKKLLIELKNAPDDTKLHLKLFECYTVANKRDEFIQHAENNTKLLNVDMVLRHRIENIYQQAWEEPLNLN